MVVRGGAEETHEEPSAAAPESVADTPGMAALTGAPRLALRDPRAVLALQRTAGNAAVTRLMARARIARAPVAADAQDASRPLLKSMAIDEAAFYRGEMVVGEIVNPGKPSTIVFFELRADRLRAGIFSISVKDDPNAALKAFGSFRGNARQLARALQLPEMELVGAAVMNNDIAYMLEQRLGFVRGMEPLPESLGALPGEQIEVFTRRFPVQGAAGAADIAPGPSAPAAPLGPAQQELAFGMRAPPGPDVGPPASAAILRPAGPAAVPVRVPPAQLELPFTRAPTPRAGGGWGPVAAEFGLYLVSNAFMDHVYRTIAANEQARLDATRPEIEARAAALGDEARARQAGLDGRTMWVNVLIVPVYWTVSDTKPFEESEWTSLKDVRVDSVALGEEYRAGHSPGEPKVVMSNGAWVNIWERHDALALSFPFPYDPSVMTRDQTVRRTIENEREAARRDLPQPVLEALSLERDALLSRRDALAQPGGATFVP